MNLKAPIYFSTGLTEKANHYYKLFITWTNQKIRKTFVQRNMFEFKHIKAFDRSYADNPGPMASIVLDELGNRKDYFIDLYDAVHFQVVFATPGMLHAGQSLQIFKKWAGNEKNMVRCTGGRIDKRKRWTKISSVGSAVSGHHARVLCARNNRSQDSKWTEETRDGRESDSKIFFHSF